MTDFATRIGRAIRQLEGRLTDLEQGRPPDSPSRQVENLAEETVTVSDSVSETKDTDITPRYNSGYEYNRGWEYNDG